MSKNEGPSTPMSSDLLCVGEMKIATPVGGSIPALSFPTFALLRPPDSSAPRYRRLCTSTNLNFPPVQTDNFTDKVKTGDSNLRDKCESLAVSGLVESQAELGLEYDVIAPVEVLKEIFRTPYWKSQLSIAVQRVGKTLVLNRDPRFEHNSRLSCDSENVDKTWFLNFTMHSMRTEQCKCSPEPISEKKLEPDSEKHNEFSRVVDTQLEEFRMRLGSDLLLFSNEKGSALSLQLSDLDLLTPPITWLETWLELAMAGVPELTLCYHEVGVVEGYEFLKTDDLYLPYGVSGDKPAFDPEAVQKNGVAVLRFLRSHCQEDPGFYSLYKTAGEDVIKLYDISKKESSSATLRNLLHQVVEGHEQFARRLILELDLTTSGTSDPSPLLQSTTSLISTQLAAVCHVHEAIKFLVRMQKLETSEQEGELPTSKLDGKLWSLVLLLGESHLSLGVAYTENGQLHQALKTVELACETYGSMPQKFEETSFASALHKSFALQLNFKNLEEFSQGEEKLEDLVSKSTAQGEAKPSRGLFWGDVWLVAGEIRVRFQLLEGSKRKENELALNPKMPSEVEGEVERLKKKLTALSKKCGSCSLVSCSCASKSRKKKLHKCGIFKYLKDDGESNWIAALDCFEESRKALVNLPSGCEEIKSIITRKALVWNEIGRRYLKSKKLKEAEEASAHAISAFKESGDLTSVILMNCNMSVVRRRRAEENSSKIESIRHIKKAYKKALECTALDYTTAIEFCKAAEADLNLAIGKGIEVAENVKVAIYGFMGEAYLKFGLFLYKENTIATAAHGLKTVRDSCPNPFEAIKEAIVAYQNEGEVGKEHVAFAYKELAWAHEKSCLRCLEPKTDDIDGAKQHAALADESWQKVSEFCSSKESLVLVNHLMNILIKRSEFSFNLPWRTYSMLELDLSNLLEARQIDEESLPKELTKNFWAQLRKVLREMVKTGADNPEKLKRLFGQSLRATSLSDLNEMHGLWTSES